MASIEHEISVNATPETVYAALTTSEGLAGWHNPIVRGDGSPGTVWHFLFENRPEFGWRVEESEPSQVRWTCTAGPGDSIGTEATFTIATAGERTQVLLSHSGWTGTHGNFRKCNTIWGVLLHHLKQYVETGTPTPAFP